MRLGRRSALGAAVLAGALVLAACGDDDSGVSSANTTAAAPTTAAATTTAGGAGGGSETTASGGGADTSATDDSTPVDTDFSGEGSDEFCSKLKELSDSDEFNFDLDNADPDALRAQYAKFQDAVETLHDLAPAEIEADVETVRKGLADFLALAEEYDFDFEKLFTAAQADPELSDRLDATLTSDEAEAADARLTAYGEQVCGITDTTGG